MGCSNSQLLLGYQELRSSITGSLVDEKDFHLFYSLCKVESERTMKTCLYPSPSQLIYVVISGEVHVNLSIPGGKLISATIFTAGETIHFFNAKLHDHSNFELSDMAECLRNDEVKLSLYFKSLPNKVARVIGIDRRAFDEFTLKASSNILVLTSFLRMNMMELFQSAVLFQNLTAEQVRLKMHKIDRERELCCC